LKNGDVYEFVDKMRYGDELIFMYRGEKYFLQGYRENDGICTTYLDRWYPPANDYIWVGKGEPHKFPVDEFLAHKLWDGKNFWDAENEMEWVDA
jgi:hypothetical protein